MAENTAISWADHTFNPWIGCTKVSPACDGCYAEAQMGMASRFGPARVQWGAPGQGEGTRSRTAPSTWAKVRKWDREAAATLQAWRTNPFAQSETPRPTTFVFCASLADVADTAVPFEWFLDLLRLANECSHLTFLFLTKRIGNLAKLARKALAALGWDRWPKNIAAGATVINQEEADRDIPKLLAFKAEFGPAFAFLSMEPLLGPVDLTAIEGEDGLGRYSWSALTGGSPNLLPALDWVITGGETDQGAHKARPADPAWFRSLRDQCAAAGTAFHFKQWGEWVGAAVYSEDRDGKTHGGLTRVEGGGAAPGAPTEWWDGDCWAGRVSVRVGKANDPCTLDGVRHDARPVVRA